jgi:IS5 family transposase
LLKIPENRVHTPISFDFMKPKKPKQQDQADLFRSRLGQILDRKHPLSVLANQIDWSVFDAKFGCLHADKGRPALSTRWWSVCTT